MSRYRQRLMVEHVIPILWGIGVPLVLFGSWVPFAIWQKWWAVIFPFACAVGVYYGGKQLKRQYYQYMLNLPPEEWARLHLQEERFISIIFYSAACLLVLMSLAFMAWSVLSS